MYIDVLVLGSYETNCYVLYTDGRDDCVIIDPGYEPNRVMSHVAALGKTVTAILLTHGHFDHVGAVREIFAETDCEIYLCPADCDMPESMTAGPLCYTCAYGEGDTVHLAGMHFQVLHTPGHTPGSVCLMCENVIFSGDTLFAGSCGRTDLPGGSWQALSHSLSRLRNIQGEYTVYPGHGAATTLSDEKTYNPYMR